MAGDASRRRSITDGTGKNGKEPVHISGILQVLVGHGKKLGFIQSVMEAAKEFLRSCLAPNPHVIQFTVVTMQRNQL